jgi:hypothetical protein
MLKMCFNSKFFLATLLNVALFTALAVFSVKAQSSCDQAYSIATVPHPWGPTVPCQVSFKYCCDMVIDETTGDLIPQIDIGDIWFYNLGGCYDSDWPTCEMTVHICKMRDTNPQQYQTDIPPDTHTPCGRTNPGNYQCYGFCE